MEAQPEKIYVAIGDDKQDGFSTLSWVLKKWSNFSSISIVILYATIPSFKDGFIQTYFGKMPANYVNDATVEALRKTKEEDNDKLLSEYQAFCGKVPTETLKIRKYDEPIHKLLVDLISGLGATKLVMDIAFMKYSSWKSKGAAISDTFYIQRNKPDFCQLFIVCGGKLMFLREDHNYSDGILVEDENGVVIASNFKEKGSSSSSGSIRGFLGKMLLAGDQKNLIDSPSSAAAGRNSPNQWDNSVHELERYFSELMTLNDDLDDNIDNEAESKDYMMENSPPESMIDSERIEGLRMKINKARETIQQMRNEARGNVERQAKAEWAHSLCTLRAKELESRINEEVISQTELKKEFENIKDQECDMSKEVEDKLQKLKSIVEVQDELSSRLHISSMARSRADLELEKAVSRRTDMVRQIEELRRQRDVLQRRIEFCKEKDAIRAANQLGGELEFQYKEFDAQEIKKATQDFSENLRLKSAGNLTNVYKGRINRTFVAIKLFSNPGEDQMSHEAFQSKVQLLGQIHHPHIVSMIGFCTELKCIVFEFMHHGSLRDVLFGTRKRNKSLSWHSRVLIASQVSSGLGFIHSARPRPIAHGNLDPSKILLNHSLVAKIHGIKLIWCQDESETKPDIRAFGNLVLQLLTGRNWAGLVIEEAMLDNHAAILKVLDPMAGQWPMDLALEFAGIGLRCLSMEIEPETSSPITRIAREMEKVRRDADELVGGTNVSNKGDNMEESSTEVPRIFVCPIFKGVMKNPHVAADGFSYELEAIEEWLSKGNDTSPVTNLKLNHKTFTPNHTLRSLIQDWHHQRHRSSGPVLNY